MTDVLIEMGKLRHKQAKRVANAVVGNASEEVIAREQRLLDEPLAKPLFPGIKTESDGARIRIGARTPFYFASSSD